MFKVVLLQFAATLIAAGLAGSLFGLREATSVGIGGIAYAFPNLLFVLRLSAAASSGTASAASFFIGELIKIAVTLMILVAAHYFFDVHWLALLVGLFVALKANLFAFLLKT